MAKRNNLNGLPHNLTKSYFGTMRYYGSGYMADWLLNAARNLRVKTVMLDIMTEAIDPKEMEKLPLLYHLKDLKKIIQKEVEQNGFEQDFFVTAIIKVEIPDPNLCSKTIYCYPELTDKEGRRYASGRIIETAYENPFDPFVQQSLTASLLGKTKRLFRKLFLSR